MNNKIVITLAILITVAAASCMKHQFLPVVTPPVTSIFTAKTLNHTSDTLNIGDTVWLNATGTIYDTTKNIYVALTTLDTVGGVAETSTYGSATSPIKVSNRVIGASTSGVYAWSALLMLPNVTNVPLKTKLYISATFQYQLSFSSELPSSLTVTDKGVKTKTIYIN